jgi:hypothetical protein
VSETGGPSAARSIPVTSLRHDDDVDAALERLDSDRSGRISWDDLRAWWEEREL